VLALTAPGASASGLNSGGGLITYTAAAAEVNTVSVSRSGDSFVFTDAAGITITPIAPCTAAGNVGSCPAQDVDTINVVTGDLNDSAGVAASVTGLDQIFLTGGTGNDVLAGAPSVPSIVTGDGDLPAGNDLLSGGGMDDQITGDGGNDVLNGGDGADSLEGSQGNDQMDGGAGFDRFLAEVVVDGSDDMHGGPDTDVLQISQRDVGVGVSLDGVANDGEACPGPGCEGDNVQPDVENVDTGSGDDTISGNGSLNDLFGGAGNDVIAGGGGYDELEGSTGDDTLSGDDGNDELSGGNGADALSGGRGDDYTFSEFFDRDQDVLSGGPGIDSIGGAPNSAFPLRIDLDNKPDDGFATPLITGPRDNVRSDVENLEGGPGPDVLVGNGAANDLDGGQGNDRLVGGKGGDALLGGRGGDRLIGGKGRDTAEGDAGADVISVRDRIPDEVLCGSSLDRVKADRADRAGPDCEKVRRR
jgi:Ca2+-binding RTX toxin-like protein